MNTEAPKDLFLNGDSPLAENTGSALQTQYNTCAGSLSWRTSLVMADAAGGCNIYIGGIPNGAMTFNSYFGEADNHLLLPAREPNGENNFTPDDFVTAAFYGLYRFYPQGSSGDFAYENFKLLAVDKQKYYFGNAPMHQPPVMSGEPAVLFDAVKSELNVSVLTAADPDTPDALLRYEISYDNAVSWEIGGLNNRKIVSPGKIYNIRVRAIDEFGTRSAPLAVDYSVPETAPAFGLSDISWRRDALGARLHFHYPNYPFVATDSGFIAMLFYLNRLPPENYSGGYGGGNYSRLQVSHFSCADFNPASGFGSQRDFPMLILADSSALVRDSSGGNVTEPNRCFTWTGLPKISALVPVPDSGSGELDLAISGTLNNDKSISSLTAEDFFTVGFYSFDLYGNGNSLANDAHKYYFQP